MLSWAIFFIVAAVIAAVLGFGGIASAFAGVAQVLFFLFLIVLAAMLILHFVRGGTRALR